MKATTSRGQYRVVKRCLYFVAFVSLLPVGVIYLVTSDQLYKLRNYSLVSVLRLIGSVSTPHRRQYIVGIVIVGNVSIEHCREAARRLPRPNDG